MCLNGALVPVTVAVELPTVALAFTVRAWDAARKGPHKPSLDQMGPGVEAVPQGKPGPRSSLGRPGMRGGFKKRRG